MIAGLLDFVTRRRLAIAVVAALIAAVGLWSFANLQIDAIPDITGVQVQVNTMVPALAPEEIERLATLPIERAMAGQPGLEETRSLTKTGLSQVTLLYKDGTDQMRARQLVTERLNAVRDQLPPGASPQLAPITTGLNVCLPLKMMSGGRSAAKADRQPPPATPFARPPRASLVVC